MGDYEILSHIEMPECSIRIIGMKEAEHVAEERIDKKGGLTGPAAP